MEFTEQDLEEIVKAIRPARFQKVLEEYAAKKWAADINSFDITPAMTVIYQDALSRISRRKAMVDFVTIRAPKFRSKYQMNAESQVDQWQLIWDKEKKVQQASLCPLSGTCYDSDQEILARSFGVMNGRLVDFMLYRRGHIFTGGSWIDPNKGGLNTRYGQSNTSPSIIVVSENKENEQDFIDLVRNVASDYSATRLWETAKNRRLCSYTNREFYIPRRFTVRIPKSYRGRG